MYTKKELLSDSSMDLYKSIGKKSLKNLNFVECCLGPNRKSNGLDINVRNISFLISGDLMHYNETLETSKDGDYIDVEVSKTIGEQSALISLGIGIRGFDIHSGERFDRLLSQVTYKYDGSIDIISLKTEEEISKEEEIAQERINAQIRQLTNMRTK